MATGCGGDASPVLVRASLGHGEPVTGLEITALPFDAEAVLDSLADAAPTPRPTFRALEAELAAYRSPEDDRLAEASIPWLALHDSVSRLADSLNGMDRRGATYARMYARFRQLYARLQQRATERDRALEELRGEDVTLARRAQAASEELRTWERDAYSAYPQIAAEALDRRGVEFVRATAAEDGTLHLELPPGEWWIVARLADPENPFQEYYWNVPLTVGWRPVGVPLSERNTVRRWRH
jgi:hypothetical protein